MCLYVMCSTLAKCDHSTWNYTLINCLRHVTHTPSPFHNSSLYVFMPTFANKNNKNDDFCIFGAYQTLESSQLILHNYKYTHTHISVVDFSFDIRTPGRMSDFRCTQIFWLIFDKLVPHSQHGAQKCHVSLTQRHYSP